MAPQHDQFRRMLPADLPRVQRWRAAQGVLIDPDPANPRAVGAHGKASFRRDRAVTLESHTPLMVCDA
jgi:hypothetical protein